MSKRRWTVVVVPQGSRASRTIQISHTAIKLALTVVVSGVALLMLLGYATLARTSDLVRADGLEQENAALAAQLGQIGGRVSSLEDTLRILEARDDQIRLLANLDPITPDVRGAGIGGPVGAIPTAASTEQTVLARRSDEIRVDLNALVRRANLLAASFQLASDSLAAHEAWLTALPSIMPTQGWLSSSFSSLRMHPILHVARPHQGVDITAPRGTLIRAPGAGTVLRARWETGFGNAVTIDHGHGIVTKFAHASKLLVRPGQKVTRGQTIALVGRTGLAVAPHLHYEVHINGRPVNPLRYILPPVITD